jgi:hypothetical protein
MKIFMKLKGEGREGRGRGGPGTTTFNLMAFSLTTFDIFIKKATFSIMAVTA